MKKTWFPQLIAAFVLAAVAGLYLVPQTLSAEEMNQIVGACGLCNENIKFQCEGDAPHCSQMTWQIGQRDINGLYQMKGTQTFCTLRYSNNQGCNVREDEPQCDVPDQAI